MKAKALALFAVERRPIATGFLEQSERADYVRVNELARPVDRSVDVRLGREMQHGSWLVLLEQSSNRGRIGDVDVLEAVPRIVRHVGQRIEIACVRQLVGVDDRRIRLPDQESHDRGADEARTAGDENTRGVYLTSH